MKRLLLISILSLALFAPALTASADTKTDEYSFTEKASNSISLSDLPYGWQISTNKHMTSTIITPESDETGTFTYFKFVKSTYGASGLVFNPASSYYSYLIIPVHEGDVKLVFNRSGTNPTVYIEKLAEQGNGTFKLDTSSTWFTQNGSNKSSVTSTISGATTINLKVNFSGYLAISCLSTSLYLQSFSNTYDAPSENVFSLTGRVKDYHGNPLGAIEVGLAEGSDMQTALTDAEGNFSFKTVKVDNPSIVINHPYFMPYREQRTLDSTAATYDWGDITLQQLTSTLTFTLDGSHNYFSSTNIKNDYSADFYGAILSLYRIPESYDPAADPDRTALRAFITPDNLVDSFTFDADNTLGQFTILEHPNPYGYVLACSPDDFTYNYFEPLFVPVLENVPQNPTSPYLLIAAESSFNLFDHFIPKTFEISGSIYEWDADIINDESTYINLRRYAPRGLNEDGETNYEEVNFIPFNRHNGTFTYTGDVRSSHYFKYTLLCGFTEGIFNALHPGEVFPYKDWYVDDLDDYQFDGRDVQIRAIAYPKGAYSLDGTVRNVWGSPVARATVEVFYAGAKCGFSSETDGGGNFHIIYAAPEASNQETPAAAPANFDDKAEFDPDFDTADPDQQGYYVKVTPENDAYKSFYATFDKADALPTSDGSKMLLVLPDLTAPSGTITGIDSIEEKPAAPFTIVGGSIQATDPNTKISVYDLSGAPCKPENLPAGIYLIRINNQAYKLQIP